MHALVERLQAVVDIGLEYLSLNRETDTLSGGESQRVRMVKHLGSSLVDVTYIFDEPSVGLHPRVTCIASTSCSENCATKATPLSSSNTTPR